MSQSELPPDLPYDPELRRDTPLALKLKERIRRHGAITVAQYMEACLQDEEHGYYRTRTAIGAQGDFVTAPEISQVFGELVGLWAAIVWQQMGSPSRFNLVELGPGRGTLMADALRAAKVVPGFLEAADVVLVESSPVLRGVQSVTLAPLADRVSLRWAHWMAPFPADRPTIVLGNEFLDALPTSQFIFSGGRWNERTVALDAAGRLVFACAPDDEFAPLELHGAPPAEGDIVERSGEMYAFSACDLARPEPSATPIAALFIDYGHARSGAGDTLQAVRGHKAEHPLTSPGEADLTAHVDFEAVREAVKFDRMAVDGPVPQANFLGALGLLQRASRLMAANPAKAHQIEAGVARLMAVPGMGDRFKAIGIRSAGLPQLPGF